MEPSYLKTKADSLPTQSGKRITLRPVGGGDLDFLFLLYASTRDGEKEAFGWGEEQWEGFLRMQFDLQHSQYMQNYLNPTFDIVLVDDLPAGRLYVDRQIDQHRIIDISLLPQFRSQGVGETLLRRVVLESEERGVPVTLYVERFNPAVCLYHRLGFGIEEDSGVFLFMVYPSPRPSSSRRPKGREIARFSGGSVGGGKKQYRK